LGRARTRWDADDKQLKIHTSGRDDYHADEHHYPYEPTPYPVLKRLAESGYIERESTVVDYGCGKGRVGFYLNYTLGCRVMGVEYDEKMYALAEENRRSYQATFGAEAVTMHLADAESFDVSGADCFYFFNPFSVETLSSVMGRVMDAYYEAPRAMYLFFYYPNDEYVSYLMTALELMFTDEIDCGDLFEGENNRERILIFEVV